MLSAKIRKLDKLKHKNKSEKGNQSAGAPSIRLLSLVFPPAAINRLPQGEQSPDTSQANPPEKRRKFKEKCNSRHRKGIVEERKGKPYAQSLEDIVSSNCFFALTEANLIRLVGYHSDIIWQSQIWQGYIQEGNSQVQRT